MILPIIRKGLASPLLILWLIIFAFAPKDSQAEAKSAKNARIEAKDIPIGFLGLIFHMQKAHYRPIGRERPGPAPGFIWGDGVVNNPSLGLSEGLPGGMIVDYAIGNGNVYIVTTPAQFNTAITNVSNSLTHDVIVISADFTITPTKTLALRSANNFRYDIISDYIYNGTFERGWNERATDADSYRTITRGLTSASNGAPLFDLGRQNSSYTDRGSGLRMMGLKLTPDPAQGGVSGYFLILGGPEVANAQNAVSKEPQNIIFDRMWLEGGVVQNKAAVLFCARNVCVRNSRIAHWWSKDVGTFAWADVNGLLSFNSSGNIAYINNYIDASGENIMFGGGAQGIGVNCENAVVRYNYVYKDRTFYAAQVASENDIVTKNLWECKQIWKCVNECNVFQQSYDFDGGGQAGVVWQIKLQSYGSPNHDPLSGHILFRRNLCIDFNIWIGSHGRDITQDSSTPTGPGEYLTHVHIIDNIAKNWDNNTPAPQTAPRIMMFTTVNGQWYIMHNTLYTPNFPSDGKVILFDASLSNQINVGVEKLVFKYNLMSWGEGSANGGIHRGASSPGLPALNASCFSWEVEYNAFVRNIASTPANYPANNFYLQFWTDVFSSSDIAAGRFVTLSSWGNRMAPDNWPIGQHDADLLASDLLGVAA